MNILKTKEGGVFVDSVQSLESGLQYGNLFISNNNGKQFIRSLENSNRNDIGKVEIERIQGLEGVIIANKVINTRELGSGGGAKKKIVSVISFNNGGDWVAIKPPSKDCEDKPYSCGNDVFTVNLVSLKFALSSTRSRYEQAFNYRCSWNPYRGWKCRTATFELQ